MKILIYDQNPPKKGIFNIEEALNRTRYSDSEIIKTDSKDSAIELLGRGSFDLLIATESLSGFDIASQKFVKRENDELIVIGSRANIPALYLLTPSSFCGPLDRTAENLGASTLPRDYATMDSLESHLDRILNK